MAQHPEVYRVWLLAARSEHDTTDRKLFVGRYWYGYPFNQLAEAYGMTPNAVSLRLHRVRLNLRAHLEERGYRI